MKHLPASALIFCLAALTVAGCSEPGPDLVAIEAARTEETARFDAFLERTWQERLADSPELRARLGQRIDPDRWDDLSAEAVDRRQYQRRVQLAELLKFDFTRLTRDARLSYELLEEELQRRIEQHRWRQHQYVLDPHNGLHAAIPAFLVDVHRIDSEADAVAYIARLRGIAPLLRQVEERLAASAALGVVPPRFVFPLVTADIRGLLRGRPFDRSATDSPLLADFRGKVAALAIPEEQRAGLLRDASLALTEAVKPAYESLATRWQALAREATDEAGAWKLPDGAQYYRTMVRWHTTADLTPDELHDIGLREVARLHREIEALMPAFGFDGTLPQFFAFMDARPESWFPDTDAGRDAYLATATARLDAMRVKLGSHFTTAEPDPLGVRRVEPFSERSAGRAFHQHAAPDDSRPATYFVNLSRMDALPAYELEALAYHEGLPGRHLQRSIARADADLPEFRRHFPAAAHTEGWALYAARLAKELGGYAEPAAEYGRLVQELSRAVRLVVDTGIHAMRWTREDAIRYHVATTPMGEAAATRAVEHSIVEPGQGTASLVGQLRLLELRRQAEADLGELFDVKEFHDVVLGAGPVSLPMLGRRVNAWIDRKREGR